jgi:hypothetical protein
MATVPVRWQRSLVLGPTMQWASAAVAATVLFVIPERLIALYARRREFLVRTVDADQIVRRAAALLRSDCQAWADPVGPLGLATCSGAHRAFAAAWGARGKPART